ncbi:MAG: hypothetical protein AAFP90_21450 [Planctomycetota bacterium]
MELHCGRFLTEQIQTPQGETSRRALDRSWESGHAGAGIGSAKEKVDNRLGHVQPVSVAGVRYPDPVWDCEQRVQVDEFVFTLFYCKMMGFVADTILF